MNTHADKAQGNKSRSIANEKAQKKWENESTFQFADNRPEAIAQRKLQEKANNSRQIKQLSVFQERINTHSGTESEAPLQRVVSKVWGKWKSSYDMTRNFESKEEATIFDDEKKAEAEAEKKASDEAAVQLAEETWVAAAKAAAWKFSDAGKRLTKHFTDGWGAKYNIQSYAQLIQAIIDGNGSIEIGKQEVYLGNFENKGDVMGCNILYENKLVSVSAGGITRDTLQSDIFHCGPTVGAG